MIAFVFVLTCDEKRVSYHSWIPLKRIAEQTLTSGCISTNSSLQSYTPCIDYIGTLYYLSLWSRGMLRQHRWNRLRKICHRHKNE